MPNQPLPVDFVMSTDLVHHRDISTEEASAKRMRRRFQSALVMLGVTYCSLFLCFKFLIMPSYNFAPFAVCFGMTSVHATVLLLDLYVFPHRPIVTLRFAAFAMVMDGFFIALAHPSMQPIWLPEWLGDLPCYPINFPDHLPEGIEDPSYGSYTVCCLGEFRSDGPWLLNLLCSFQVFLLLRSAHSLLAVPLCQGLYVGMKALSSSCECEIGTVITDFIFYLIPLLLAIGAKKMLERSEDRLYRLIMSQQKEIVVEKVLRCESEFARDGLPSPRVPAPQFQGSGVSQPFKRNSQFSEPSSVSMTIGDTDFSQITVHTALAQPFGNQCLLETAQIWTRRGAVDVRDLQAGSELIDTEGDVVRVRSIVPKPNWERDFVEVELEEGGFEVTSSHLLEASMANNVWCPWLAGDLRSEMLLRTEVGPRPIIDIHKKPRCPVTVIEIELERNATVWLDACGVRVSIFGAQVEKFIEEVHNLVYLKPPCSLYGVRSSASEPDIAHSCNGACHHWKNLGKCKYGQDCIDCHVWGCTRVKIKFGQRQRRRVKRARPDQPIVPPY